MDATAPDHHRLIYTDAWRRWRDPEIPEYLDPTALLLDKHLGMATAAKTALWIDGTPVSYADLLAEVCRAANGLAALGLGPDDRILLFATDSLEFVATWLGAIRAGVVPAVVSDQYKTPMLLYFLRDTAAKALYIDAEQLDKLDAIRAELPASLKTVIVRGEAGGRGDATYAAMTEGRPAAFAAVPRHHNDLAYMFYSGGTTGTAKGITHLAHDFLLVPERQGAFWEYGADDVVHATSKKYFTHGLWPGVLIPLYFGATGVASRLPPAPESVLAILNERAVTKLVTVPTVIKMLLLHLDERGAKPDCPALRFAVSASEKMPPEIFEAFRAAFGVELFDSIGSSEITYEWIANRPADFRRGSLGRPVFGYEVKLVDANGTEVGAPGVDGEAWIKSRTACFYYWRKYDKSRETFIGEWARTGDTLAFDEDGYFWFSGRSDDMFKVKGLWVSPIEVEAAITEHPKVVEAAVIGVDDSGGLIKPKAFVVLRPGEPGSDALAGELRAAVRALGGYKVPEEIAFVDSLPRTTLMKIDRRALRQEEAARRGR